MDEKEYLENVDQIIEMLLKNAAHSFGIDFALVNDTAIETTQRLKKLEELKNGQQN